MPGQEVEFIRTGETLLAILIPAAYHGDPGVQFFTPHSFSQQLGHMRRPAGDRVAPHRHREIARRVERTQEVLLVRSGLIRVVLYDEAGAHHGDRELGPGDVILLAAGGHGVEVLEAAEIVEVKQGPYAGEDDKLPL